MSEGEAPLTRDEILRGHRAIKQAFAIASVGAIATALLAVATDTASVGLAVALLAAYLVGAALFVRWFARRRDDQLRDLESEVAGGRPPPID